jgi:hypothetical protein
LALETGSSPNRDGFVTKTPTRETQALPRPSSDDPDFVESF